MSTSTLEQIDWATCLDDEPVCEERDCENPALFRIRWQCGCASLACTRCLGEATDWLARYIGAPGRIIHGACGRRLIGSWVSDVMTVIPL